MTSITIDLPDDQAIALKMRAAEEGLSLEGWASPSAGGWRPLVGVAPAFAPGRRSAHS